MFFGHDSLMASSPKKRMSKRQQMIDAFAPLIDLTGQNAVLVPADEHQAMLEDWQTAGNDLRRAIRQTKDALGAEYPALELVEAP